MLICSLIETIGGLPPHTVYSAKLSQIQSDESAPPTSQGIHSRCQAVRHTKEGGSELDASSHSSPLRADWAPVCNITVMGMSLILSNAGK